MTKIDGWTLRSRTDAVTMISPHGSQWTYFKGQEITCPFAPYAVRREAASQLEAL